MYSYIHIIYFLFLIVNSSFNAVYRIGRVCGEHVRVAPLFIRLAGYLAARLHSSAGAEEWRHASGGDVSAAAPSAECAAGGGSLLYGVYF